MTNRTRTRTPVILSIAALLSACEGAGRPPTSASPQPPAAVTASPLGPYTLSGFVFEVTPAGRLPIEGVEVYCDSCGSPVGHTFAYTDANGSYSFSWTNDGDNPLYVSKTGYDLVDPTGTMRDSYGRVKVVVNGDTRFDVELARR